MSAEKPEFSEVVASKLEQLYPNGLQQMISMNPTISGISLDQFLDCIKKQPNISQVTKDPTLDTNKINDKDIKQFYTVLDKIPCGPVNAIIEATDILKFDNVKYRHSLVKNGKLQSPMFSVTLDVKEPYQSVCINTGYIVKIPMTVPDRVIEGDQVKTLPAMIRQENFVIIPKIMTNKGCRIIPSIYARDPEDTGYYTINFTLLEGHLTKVIVTLLAFSVVQTGNTLQLLDPEPNTQIFKPKDMHSGRLVKNPRVKIGFDTAQLDDNEQRLVLKTFNGTVSPPVFYDKQRLTVQGESVLFTTRKREWMNPKMITLSGVFNINHVKDKALPRVSCTELPEKNTHCVVVINSRCALFSVKGDKVGRYRYLNGAFHNITNYERIIQALRNVLSITESIRFMALHQTHEIEKKPEMEQHVKQKMLIFDYNRGLVFSENQLNKMMNMTEKELYETKSGNKSKPYSVTLRNALIFIGSVYFPDIFKATVKSDEKTITAEDTNADATINDINKRKHDDVDDDDGDTPKVKHLKN